MEFLDLLSDYQLLKGSDPHSKLKNINIFKQHHKNPSLPCYEPVQSIDYFPKKHVNIPQSQYQSVTLPTLPHVLYYKICEVFTMETVHVMAFWDVRTNMLPFSSGCRC
jgi:hypothetical protein